MSFIEPIFLFGALTLVIPVIIHLLKLNKPERVAFSTLAFFKEMVDSTLQRLNIKRWLLLVLRMLALLMLTLALAQPYFKTDPSAQLRKGSQLSLLIDNSPSTLFADQKGVRLYRLIDHARLLIGGLDENATVYLAPTHGNWKYNAAKRPSEAIALLDEIQAINAVDMTTLRFERMIDQLNAGTLDGQFVLLHDAQKASLEHLIELISTIELEGIQHRIGVGVLEAEGGISNSWLSGIELESAWLNAGQKIGLTALLNEAFSERVSTDSSTLLSMYVNNRMIGQQNPKQSQTFEFSPQEPGFYQIRAVLEGDAYPLDNEWFSSLYVPKALRLLWVTDDLTIQQRNDRAMVQVLQAAVESGYALEIEYAQPGSLPLEKLQNSDVLVMDGVSDWPTYADEPIRNFVQQQGGGLWLIPSSEVNLAQWNRKMAFFDLPEFRGITGEMASFERVTGLERLRGEHPVFRQMFASTEAETNDPWTPVVDSPSIYYHYTMDSKAGAFAILQDEARNPLLVEKKLGKGRIWSSAMGFGPSWSNISVKALFAPLVFNGLQYLKASDGASFFYEVPLVAPLEFESSLSFNEERISAQLNDSLTFGLVRADHQSNSVETRWTSTDDLWERGFVKLSKDNHVNIFGLNPLANEGNPTFFDLNSDPLQSMENLRVYQIESISAAENTSEKRSSFISANLRAFFLFLALLCLFAESLVARFYRVQQKPLSKS